MPKVSPLQSSFSGGEFSPLLYGRVDSDRYRTALAVCENYLPTIQGGLIRRPGTYFVAETKDSSRYSRLVSFEFSTTQAYILEFGHQYIRFYRNHGQIISGTPYEIASPYDESDLFQLKFTQSADVLYIVHPEYAQRQLTRTSHTSWTLSTMVFEDGPYLPTNTTSTTLSPSATSGAITITASASLFASTDVDRLVRMKHGSTWGYARITGYISPTQVNANVVYTFGAAAAVSTWRLGVWSNTTGFPGCVVFHEDRLFFGGVTSYPQRLDGSKSSDYLVFSPTATDGTVADDNAISTSLNANDVNVIRWLTSDEKGLLAGSVGGEWIVRPSSQNEALSPTNITAKKATSYGSANIQPVQVGKSTLFIQRAGKKLRDLIYFYDVDGFRANDLTVLAEHITGTGITQVAFQKEPQSVIWCVRSDGVLASMTYERDTDTLRVGWSRHIIGGVSNLADEDANVESVAVIPSPDGLKDEVWVIVHRYIDGATVRYVEYLSPLFDDNTEQKDAFFVDSGLTYDSPKTILDITQANPCVVTSNSHGFSNGDQILISDVSGMTELNGNRYTVAGVTANTFQLSGVNSTTFQTYAGAGEARKYVSTISGLDHLEGESVAILADGAVQPNQTVSSGSISLAASATTVQVGLNYTSNGQMLRLEAGAADGTALGKTRRTHRVGFLLHRSLGLKIGTSFEDLDTVVFRDTSDPLTRAPELFTGIISETLNANYDFENQICWRQDQPLPSMILAVMPQMVTQDRG